MKKKYGLVISGGGALMSWANGFLSEKIRQGYSWDEYDGTSAGALAAVLASTGNPELIKKASTTMGNKDIWSSNPFQKDGDIKKVNLIKSIALKKDYLGSTRNLRKNLSKFYTEEIYNDVISKGKGVVACVSDYTTGQVAYGRNDKHDYKTFLDYVWASTCVPIICEGVTIDGHLCQDGGLLMNIPIQRAIDNGCDEIDVIILQQKNTALGSFKPKSMINIAGRSVSMMMKSITNYSVIVPQLNAEKKGVKLRLRYLPYSLVENSEDVLNFDKKQMSEWFYMGEEYAKIENTSEKIRLNK